MECSQIPLFILLIIVQKVKCVFYPIHSVRILIFLFWRIIRSFMLYFYVFVDINGTNDLGKCVGFTLFCKVNLVVLFSTALLVKFIFIDNRFTIGHTTYFGRVINLKDTYLSKDSLKIMCNIGNFGIHFQRLP